jgi:hypothetical protein
LRTSRDERLQYYDKVVDDPVAAYYNIDASVKLQASNWSSHCRIVKMYTLRQHSYGASISSTNVRRHDPHNYTETLAAVTMKSTIFRDVTP